MRGLLGLSTLMIVFLVLLLGSAIEEYQEQPQNYSWIDANGEFKTSSYDLTVSYNLDTPIDDLNGYSLRKVFEDERAEVTGYGAYISFVNGKYVLDQPYTTTNLFSHVRYYNMYPLNANDDIYIYLDHNETISLNWYFQSNSPYQQLGYNDFNTIDNRSVIYTRTTTMTSLSYILLTFYSNIPNLYYEFNDIVVVNLTHLGINQTKDEMDFWYSEYQRLQENRVEDMKYLGGEITSQWTTFNNDYLQPTLDAIALYVKWLTNPAGVLTDLLENIIIVDTIG